MRKYVWKALVWVMIPFTLVAGLPRMHCHCAQAEGLLFGRCCFESYSSNSTGSVVPTRHCCCRKAASTDDSASQASAGHGSAGECSLCTKTRHQKTGNCCSWRSAVLTGPSEGVLPSVPMDVVAWNAPVCNEVAAILGGFAPHRNASVFLPQIDRLTVSQHLVI